ncbi:Hypothetical predicted protein [Cloeon dipterum]|uniref:Uncharacterized protein n=1 Tax=Cloeon dipterum TaxID=197152 RepID=A0A8S1CW13_9INSE|nr:Hypothetical predicted protein [Cloeon dipterum]
MEEAFASVLRLNRILGVCSLNPKSGQILIFLHHCYSFCTFFACFYLIGGIIWDFVAELRNNREPSIIVFFLYIPEQFVSFALVTTYALLKFRHSQDVDVWISCQKTKSVILSLEMKSAAPIEEALLFSHELLHSADADDSKFMIAGVFTINRVSLFTAWSFVVAYSSIIVQLHVLVSELTNKDDQE